MRAEDRDLIEVKAMAAPQVRAAMIAQAGAFVFAIAQAGALGFVLAAFVAWGRIDLALIGAWLVFSLLRLGCAVLADIWGAEASAMLKRTLRTRAADAYLERGGRAGASLVAAINDDIDAIGPFIARYEPVRSALIAGLVAALVFSFSQSWVVGAILLLTGPLTPIFMALVGYRAQEEARRKLDALQDMSRYFLGRLRALAIISAYGGEAMEAQRLRQRAEAHRSASVGVLRVAFLSSATIDFFATLSIALVATYVGLSLLGIMPFSTGETLTAAEGFAALMIAPEFFAPLRRFAQAYHDRADAAAAAARLAPFLEAAGSSAAPCRGLSASSDRIVLSALQAGFPGGARTQPMSAVLRRGELIALVGDSGAGKTALPHTLAGLIAPAAGEITACAGARPVLVAQTPFLFAGSVRDNLLLGGAYTDERMIAALIDIGLGDSVDAARTLLERPLGEIALGVSGGEGRRLAVARAILREAPALLLDEPTAHLDMASEQAMLATLQRLARERAVIVATHSPALKALANQQIEVRPA